MLVYRTDQPFAKLAVTGAEVLGAGQQFVAFGRHPAGRLYGWPLGDTPLDTPLEDSPAVDRDSCAQLLGELAQLLPQRSQNPRGSRNAAPGAPAGPARDAEGRVIDGRDGWLSTLAYHAVQDVLHSEGALDAERLAAAVWRRFEETAALGRPKQAAGAAYGFEDAARKVADKLRLLREGRLPPRETPAVDAPEVDGLPIDAARAELDRLIVAACARIADWRLGEAAGPTPQIGIRATVGLGKSTVARQRLVELREQLLNGGAPARILICAPSHALAEETAKAWRDTGLSTAVLRGYRASHPGLRRGMCSDIDAVEAATTAGLDVQTTVCAASNGRRCAFFAGCLKQVNRAEVAEADVVVAPYDALFTGFAGQLDTIGLVLIDEGCWGRAAVRQGGVYVETFPHAHLTLTPRRRGRHAFDEDADLHDLRRRAAATFAANGPGPLKQRDVVAAGLSAEDVLLAAAFERRRLIDPGLYPGMPQDERRAALGRAQVNAVTYRHIALWEALHGLLSGAADTDGRIEIAAADARTGLREVEVLGVKPVHQNLRNRPMLHLDATLRQDLARAILPELQATHVDAEAPHMQLRLITGAFGKRNLCVDAHADPAEAARRANRLSECVDYVRWHARRLAGKRTLVITYKDCEAVSRTSPALRLGISTRSPVSTLTATWGLIVSPAGRCRKSRDVPPLCASLFGHAAQGGYRVVQRGRTDAPGGRAGGADPRCRPDGRDAARRDLRRRADPGDRAWARGHRMPPIRWRCMCADVALPLVHDRLLTWATETPDSLQRMLLTGIAVDSPGGRCSFTFKVCSIMGTGEEGVPAQLIWGTFPYRNPL